MINCILRGHKFENEVQVTMQVFFPGERFTCVDQVSGEGFSVVSEPEKAWIFKDGAEISFYEWRGEKTDYLNPRRIVMLTIFHALKQVTNTETPWGALTGIRPSKLVREWLDDGTANEEIINRLEKTFQVSAEKSRLALEVAHAEKRIANHVKDTIGFYISVPFCPSRCVYCSFNTSQKPPNAEFLQKYIEVLAGEIEEQAERATKVGSRISSIYIGGGTPTILNEKQLEMILSVVVSRFGRKLGSTVEFTVEAGRPDTLTAEKLAILRSFGVNRLAVNPQTLNDDTLRVIGRNHTAADFFTAFETARKAGFECLNVDLIAGLPGEEPNDMLRNFHVLSDLKPENITVHTLAVKRASKMNENGHTFGANRVEEMLSIAAESCAKMGLLPYYLYRQKNMVGLFENVGYSQPNRESLYNVGMMAEVQTIFGAGAGAVTKFVEGTKIWREFNPKNPEIYIERRQKNDSSTQGN